MKSFYQSVLPVLLLFLCTISCNKSTKDIENVEEPSVVSTFYFIRHAEKDRTDSSNADPELNQDGLGRAIKWAEVFDPVMLDAIYSTNYERTSMTAAPTSVKKEIEIEYFDYATLNVANFLETNEGRNVLVVGHSNTTPAMANQVLGEEYYQPMADDDNSSLFVVRIIGDKATSFVLKMD
ncbi:MAG: phosphoglycerate mutase family protein [Bacteroidota bacterium]